MFAIRLNNVMPKLSISSDSVQLSAPRIISSSSPAPLPARGNSRHPTFARRAIAISGYQSGNPSSPLGKIGLFAHQQPEKQPFVGQNRAFCPSAAGKTAFRWAKPAFLPIRDRKISLPLGKTGTFAHPRPAKTARRAPKPAFLVSRARENHSHAPAPRCLPTKPQQLLSDIAKKTVFLLSDNQQPHRNEKIVPYSRIRPFPAFPRQRATAADSDAQAVQGAAGGDAHPAREKGQVGIRGCQGEVRHQAGVRCGGAVQDRHRAERQHRRSEGPCGGQVGLHHYGARLPLPA